MGIPSCGGAGGRGVTRAHPLGNLGPPIGVEAITSHEVDKVKDPTVEQGVCHNRIFHSSSLATPRCFFIPTAFAMDLDVMVDWAWLLQGNSSIEAHEELRDDKPPAALAPSEERGHGSPHE